jgi:hypothetical protein
LLISLNLILIGCGSLPKRNPLPETHVNQAKIPGIPLARFWGDEIPPDLETRLDLVREQIQITSSNRRGRTIHYLAISGGGADGAFGAGLIVGWSAAGSRPEFTIVTGISTGALMAPFAFLGPDYDGQLRKFYTTTSTASVKPSLKRIVRRSLNTLIRNQGIGELHSIYIASVRDDINFNLAYIPQEFDLEPKETFDPEYMRQLFEIGYHMALNGYPWEKIPPGFGPLLPAMRGREAQLNKDLQN